MFQKVTNFFQGRHTTFIISAFSTGIVMSWFHRLDGNLVTLILGLGGLVTAHSVKEDYFAQKIG